MSTANGAAARAPGGWQLIAFASEITEDVTALALGPRRLVAVRGAEGKIQIFDGTCPHRGAHLGYGGRAAASGRSIVCPFHGKRIGLGEGAGRLCVREHETLDCGEVIFARLSDVPARDDGFALVVKDLTSARVLVGSVTGQVRVPPELVIENAFDFSHFPTVHLIPRISRPKVWLGAGGELNITTAFHTRAPDWETAEGDFVSQFHARAFNPHLVVSQLGLGESSRFVITGAVPAPGGCSVHIAIAVSPDEPPDTVQALVEGSKIAFGQDLAVWDHLDLTAPARLDASDAPVLAFRTFCTSFAAAGPVAVAGGE